MILSVSRRTDIPNYYSEWFFNRIKEGFLYVKNPMNIHQVSKINLSPGVIDCIVFWTKNPANMLDRLDELKEYNYYFHFTVTGYGRDIEPQIPDKRSEVLETFKKLSEKIGKERVIWRYDPVLISDKYTAEYHLRAFDEIANVLEGYTDKVIISFLDLYTKIEKNIKKLNIRRPSPEEAAELAKRFSELASQRNLIIETCAEEIDLHKYGVSRGSCIDKDLIEKIIGCGIKLGKDKNQRSECGCFESIDIGSYNTCLNGCKYCYANFSEESVKKNAGLYDASSPLLCGKIGDGDKITERNMKSLKDGQISLLI